MEESRDCYLNKCYKQSEMENLLHGKFQLGTYTHNLKTRTIVGTLYPQRQNTVGQRSSN